MHHFYPPMHYPMYPMPPLHPHHAPPHGGHENTRKKYKSSRKSFKNQNKKRRKWRSPSLSTDTDLEIQTEDGSIVSDLTKARSRAPAQEDGSIISELPNIPKPKPKLPNIKEGASLQDTVTDVSIPIAQEKSHSAPTSPKEVHKDDQSDEIIV